MRLSRANLCVVGVASGDPSEPRIQRMHVDEDGSTVAAGTAARALMAVEPVDKERAAVFPLMDEDDSVVGGAGVGVPTDVVRRALSDIPKEKRASLHYAQLTRCTPKEVELTTTDGMRKRSVSGAPMRGRFPNWRDAIRGAAQAARARGSGARVCVDGKVLVQLLQAVLQACPDPGNRNPVFLELGGDKAPILVRGVSYESNQRVLGVVKPLDTSGQWPTESEWEADVMGLESESEKKPVAKRRARG